MNSLSCGLSVLCPRAVAGIVLVVLVWGAHAGLAHQAVQPEAVKGERLLSRNLARLHETCPGADRATAWLRDDKPVSVSGLNDGRTTALADTPPNAAAVGIEWPIGHVLDGASLFFADNAPDPSAVNLEIHDGLQWRPVEAGLTCQVSAADRRLTFRFETIATRAFRASFKTDDLPSTVTEIEVHRYLPSSPNIWPERLVVANQLERRILASGEEASFESLARHALSMTPARALLGLKDASHEIGIAWDGTVLSTDTLTFSVGEDRWRLADVRETVRRRLLDGWRPGTVVEGQMGDLAVRQTAFVCPAGDDDSRGVLCIRVEIENLSDKPVHTWVEAEVAGKRASTLEFRDGSLVSDGQVVLLSQSLSASSAASNRLRVEISLPPRQSDSADMVYLYETLPPEVLAACRSRGFDRSAAEFKQYWDELLASRAGIEVPETRINLLYRAVLSQIFINGDGDMMYYGSAPSAYEKNLYGIEESYCMRALAFSGFGGDAQRYMDATYLTPKFLTKTDEYRPAARHQQYRNGLQPHYAATVYRFTRDRDWIARHVPLLKQCAEWTIAQRRKTMVLEDGKKPLHWGLLPKWAYGGDIGRLQCYPLYPNFCCWRGLVDTAWILEELGDVETARRYADEAREYREVLDGVVETLYRKGATPPWLPLRLYADKIDEAEYYQLFAGCFLDVSPFDPRSKQVRYFTEFLEADNRLFCFMPRFRRLRVEIGSGGLDGIYGLGYLHAKLHQDAVAEYVLGFYGYLAFNMEHDTFAARETSVIYASDLQIRSDFPVPNLSDPLPCGSVVALHYLRNMLVTEELGEQGNPSGNLLLLAAAPRRWLDDDQSIRLADVPTQYGPVSLEVRSHANAGRIEATLSPPRRNPCQVVKLRLRHPDGRPIHDVTVNGKPWSNVEPKDDWILLPTTEAQYKIVARYE